MAEDAVREILQRNQRLLESIARADWDAYAALCDTSVTAFEPEALGQLVEGLDFHRFYFRLGAPKGQHNTTMASPRVRLMGDVAVVTYVRLDQRVGADGQPLTRGVQETRVWQRVDNVWKHVHFHRSPVS